MKKAKLINKSCFERYVLEMLIALELLMSFTFLGYIHIPPISITFAYIPILIAGCYIRSGRIYGCRLCIWCRKYV